VKERVTRFTSAIITKAFKVCFGFVPHQPQKSYLWAPLCQSQQCRESRIVIARLCEGTSMDIHPVLPLIGRDCGQGNDLFERKIELA